MVKLLDHPIINDKMSRLRDKNTPTVEFRRLTNEITSLLYYEISRDLKTYEVFVETPITTATCQKLEGKKGVIVPILRAGLGMVDGILVINPELKVAHIGLYRDEETLEAIEYFSKFPSEMDEREAIIVDPMLATGGSAKKAIDIVKATGCKKIKLVSILASPKGVETIEKNHPDVDIFLAAMDEDINENGYIIPGLGDAGDRIFGTK